MAIAEAEEDGLLKQKLQRQRQPVPSYDMIVEILSRLPVKTLLRFRSVSNSWHDLISGRDFVKKHLSLAVNTDIDTSNSAFRFLLFQRPPQLSGPFSDLYLQKFESSSCQIINYKALKKPNHHNVAAHVLASHHYYEEELHDFPADILNHEEAVVGSCNGLICLQAKFRMYILDGLYLVPYPTRIVLWNPSTRQTRKLPDLDYFSQQHWFYGFGYDSATEDYKVILGHASKIAIFALKTGSWRILEDLENDSRYVDGQGYFFKGALHWLDLKCMDPCSIFYFDFTDEKLHSLPPLRHNLPYLEQCRLGTIGNICPYIYTRNLSFGIEGITERETTIWVMKEYGVEKSWTKFAKIPFEIVPVLVLEDGEVLIKTVGMMYLYNRKEETCRKVKDLSDYTEVYTEVGMYVESFVSPHQ